MSRISPQGDQEPTRLAAMFGTLSDVWLRFLVAIIGLTAAFTAALFSTLARQSGNVTATAIFASVALLLACLVGLTTVPYLWRRVSVEHVRDAFDYEVTRAGVVYLALAVVLGLAAVNTGNNLLYLIVAAMLSAVVISGAASAVVLRAVEMDVHLPDHVFAERAVLARVTLRNRRTWLPAFSVSVVPPRKKKGSKQWHWEPSVFAFPAQRPPDQQWIRLPDRVLRRGPEQRGQAGILEGPVYFPYIPARQAISADVELVFARRGMYRQDNFGVATRFPFSFLTKTRRITLAKEIVVFPPVAPTDEFLEILPLITGEFESFMRGRGYDLYRIRDYAPEDSARHVDWKASAKAGALLVREFTREDERKLRIVFDNPSPEVVPERAYERAVALAASLAWHFSNEQTDISYVAPGYTGKETYEFLKCLAVIQPKEESSVVDKLQFTEDYNLIITSRARGSIPTALWARSYLLFIQERV